MPSKKVNLYLSGDKEADKLLSKDPFALLIGMVLDQQVPLEWAFYGPLNLRSRVGVVTPASLVAMAEDDLVTTFCARPAMHRYPAAMARRVHELSRTVVDEYDGQADKIWTTAPSGADLLKRIKRLPGFGEQKAKIFVALLGKQLGVQPDGWRQASSPFGEEGTHMSVADINSPDTLVIVREHKREMKAARKAEAAAAMGAPAPATKAATAKVVRAAAKAGATKVAAAKAGVAKAGVAKPGVAKAGAAKAGVATTRVRKPAVARSSS